MNLSTEEALNIISNVKLIKKYQPRTLIVCAHPDDETLFAGTIMIRINDTFIVHVTNGSPERGEDYSNAGFSSRKEYAAARRDELLKAAKLAGIPSDRCICLKIIDQQTIYNINKVVDELEVLISNLKPKIVLTHPYEGGHPDHDSTCFAVHHALQKMRTRDKHFPALLEFSSYHNLNGQISFLDFLPDSNYPSCKVYLNKNEKKIKTEMIYSFKTQLYMTKNFPTDFEVFRAAPNYDFSKPPHKGVLFYEEFDWGVNGEEWRNIVTHNFIITV